MADRGHPRLIVPNFLSSDQCKEFEFIHKSCSTIGYRPNVFSTTLSHLIATNSSHLILPFVPIRERLKEKVEEFFGCEYELSVEFTGLISWSRGASIGWHSDDNRPYLKQRDFAAVCYLNNYGKDFKGGLFHFQDGDPTVVVPMAGDVIMYTADSRNIHSVDEIIAGERITLTLWFSRDGSHDEDAKLISLLSHSLLQKDSFLPSPASSNMYWFPPDQATDHQSGFDIRWARLHALGYDLYFCQDKTCLDSSQDFSVEPLQPARGDELFDHEFDNILHVLQVLQYYYWKAADLQTAKDKRETNNMVVELSKSQKEIISGLKFIFLKDYQLVETVFNSVSQVSSDWANIFAAISAWEDYTSKLRKEIFRSLPYWRNHQSIFSVPSDGSWERN